MYARGIITVLASTIIKWLKKGGTLLLALAKTLGSFLWTSKNHCVNSTTSHIILYMYTHLQVTTKKCLCSTRKVAQAPNVCSISNIAQSHKPLWDQSSRHRSLPGSTLGSPGPMSESSLHSASPDRSDSYSDLHGPSGIKVVRALTVTLLANNYIIASY